MTYYLVTGRMHGDDEATTLICEGGDRSDAVACYWDAMRSASGFDCEADMPDDGPGHVYIDAVFDCGNRRPVEV